MKTLKTLLTVISILATSAANACGGYYIDWQLTNIFQCIEPVDQTFDTTEANNFAESVDFWYEYAGKKVSKEDLKNDMSALNNVQLNEGATQFLYLNTRLYNILHVEDWWDYEKPNPGDIEEILKQVQALKVDNQLEPRRMFLEMRCLYALERYADCQRIWEEKGSQLPEGKFKNRVKGYIAGTYYKQKDYLSAINLYHEVGDNNGVYRCVDHYIGYQNVENLYKESPNSPLLAYVLQDYANAFYLAKEESGRQYVKDNKEFWQEKQKMINLAYQAISDKKTSNPMMWQSFIAFMQWIDHDYNGAYESYQQAEKMKGNDCTKENVRMMKFIASIQADKTGDYDKFFTKEYKYAYDNMSKKLKDIYPEEEGSGVPAIDAFFGELTPRAAKYFEEQGNPNRAFLIKAIADDGDPQTNFSPWGKPTFTQMDKEMTTQEVIDILAYMNNECKKNALDKQLYALCNIPVDEMKELIGTKYMREGNFEAAVVYLAQVSDDFLSHMNIQPYLVNRDFQSTPFPHEYDDSDGPFENLPAVNKKLEFCNTLINLGKSLSQLEGDDLFDAEYKMADLLYQASLSSGMWAISSYGWTCGGGGNEFNILAEKILLTAITKTSDRARLVKGYYGLAQNAIGIDSNYVISEYGWRTDEVKKNSDMSSYYKKLVSIIKKTDREYQICDVLKDYEI